MIFSYSILGELPRKVVLANLLEKVLQQFYENCAVGKLYCRANRWFSHFKLYSQDDADGDVDDEGSKGKKGKGSAGKDLKVSDMDDWVDSEDEPDSDDDGDKKKKNDSDDDEVTCFTCYKSNLAQVE